MFKGWGGTSHTALGTEQCIHSIRPGPLGHRVFLLQHPGWRAGAGVVRFGCWVTWKSLWVFDSFGRAGYVSIDAKSSFLSPEHTSTMTKTVANRIKKRFKEDTRKLHTDSYQGVYHRHHRHSCPYCKQSAGSHVWYVPANDLCVAQQFKSSLLLLVKIAAIKMEVPESSRNHSNK